MTTTHRSSCINYALTVIAENNESTRCSDERDGTETELTPETAEYAGRWVDEGIVECKCGDESEIWHRMWSTR